MAMLGFFTLRERTFIRLRNGEQQLRRSKCTTQNLGMFHQKSRHLFMFKSTGAGLISIVNCEVTLKVVATSTLIYMQMIAR